MILTPLKMADLKFGRLFPAQPAAQEDPEQRPVSLALERVKVGHLQERPCLVGSEPVPQTHAEVLRPFDSPDSSGKIRAQKTGIGSFIRETPDGGEPAIDRSRRKLTRFQMNSIPGDNCLVER